MSPLVQALDSALSDLRVRLMATPRTDPGFGETKALYRELTSALINAAEKGDADLALEIEAVSTGVVEEWQSNRDKLAAWQSVLRPVIQAVGAITTVASLGNPLAVLLEGLGPQG
jgi:hypothetical protein